MQYLGGKARIAKKLVAFLESQRKPGQLYVEPFLGGCNVLPLVSGERWGNDILPDMIMLFEAIRDGWVPPKTVTREEYEALRHAEPSALRGFVGAGCSFGGMWFSSFADGRGHLTNNKGEFYAHNVLLKMAPKIQGVEFFSKSYLDLGIPGGSLIYCDPPYKGTAGYKGVEPFNHDRFWQWAKGISQRCDVFVSEYQAPEGWKCVWSVESALYMKRQATGSRTERLFKWSGKQ